MTATTRRYGWTMTTNNQQQPLQRFLQTISKSYVTATSVQLELEPVILAHYRPVYLSSPVNYPVVITTPVAGQTIFASLLFRYPLVMVDEGSSISLGSVESDTFYEIIMEMLRLVFDQPTINSHIELLDQHHTP